MKKNCLYKEMERWLIKYKRNAVKVSSYERFMNALRLLGHYDIANMEPATLTTDDVRDFLNGLIDDGYAKETIKKPFKLLCEFLDYCFASGIIRTPIHKYVKLPKESAVHKKKRPIEVYDEFEQRRLISEMEQSNNPCILAGLMMLETGMRAGEVMALSWEDVDWKRRSVHICKTTVRCEQNSDDYIQHEPKTFSSDRTIALSLRAQNVLRRVIGESNVGFVFHGENGEPLRYDQIKYWIKQVCKWANVEYRGQHVFRHTFATNCYYKGCDVQLLSKMLGHSNVSTTYNMYIHLYGDVLEDMRKIVE